MDESQTVLLGLIAGVTILLGLPIGRLRAPAPGARVFLNATAIGVLVFLLWDVLAHAWEPVDAAIADLRTGVGDFGPVLAYGLLFIGGIAVGLLALVAYENLMTRTAPSPARSVGPGAMIVTERAGRGVRNWSAARRTALLIAVGIGLHNFGEGLAIGNSAAQGEIGLATLLVFGFALHNATEGFGIVAPLAAANDRPGWGFLLLMGLIGGGPTVLGTLIGRQFTSDALAVTFLTLAAGSILYVVIQLIGVALRFGLRNHLYWGILAGVTAGFVTDMVVTAGGA
jgi:zinc transporter, ZIP family